MTARWTARVAGACLLAGLLSAASAQPARLGVVYDESTAGKPETSGNPVHSGSLVRTMTHGALLRLDNGQLLRLRANTAALFEGQADGFVAVTVLSGRLATVDGAGQLALAGHGSRFTLEPTDRDGAIAERRLLAADLERPQRPEPEGRSTAAR